MHGPTLFVMAKTIALRRSARALCSAAIQGIFLQPQHPVLLLYLSDWLPNLCVCAWLSMHRKPHCMLASGGDTLKHASSKMLS